MKARCTPCTECRKHRRKCVRPDASLKCVRCERLGKSCLQPTHQDDASSDLYSIDAQLEEHQDMDALKDQVKQLEKAVHFMEEQLQFYRSKSRHLISDSSTPCHAAPLATGDRQPLSALSSTMLQSLFHNWKVKIENGNFQIETGIRNISELLQFDPTVSYLSPLGGFRSRSTSSSSSSFSSASSSCSASYHCDGDDDSPTGYYRGCNASFIMSFGKEGTSSLIPFTIKILTRCIKTRPASVEPPSTLLLPSILLLDPTALVDQLLTTYFACHNVYNPLVHEPTYRAKLAAIQDPLTDLITLGICAYVCSTPCRHLHYSPRERRNMGDYFHAKARNIILDQFDLPEKRLENVIGINLLIQYMHITLKFAECRQLVSMAYQILLDLRNEYPEFRPTTGPSACFERSPHAGHYTYTTEQAPITDVEKMLFTRHVTISTTISRLMDYIADDVTDNECFHFPVWKYVDDECEETKRFVRSQNWIINLYNHEFVMHFVKQIHRVHVGRTCTLSFEAIVRMHDVMKEWARSIPAEFRLCDDLYDAEMCFQAIDRATDSVLLTNFIQFHLFHVSTYSCLLQPKSLADDDQQILSWVQEHSLTTALRSCRLLLYAIRRLAVADTSSCNYILSASEFLFHALDVLVLLALSPNKHIAKEARAMMKSCLSELDSIKFMQGHQVPSEELTSPLTKNMFKIMSGNKFDVDYYDQFPHPWFAMMYDASHFITSQ
ncbi:hypothetical protein MBANPS3_007008 [Mucor bainieri]